MATGEKLSIQPRCCGKMSRHIFKVKKVDFSIADCKLDDVKYKVYRNNSDEAVPYTEDTIKSAELDLDLPFTVLIHDWLSNGDCYWYEPFRKALFQIGQNNLVCVDWSISAAKYYDMAAANSKYVGGFIADFILASKVDIKKVHVIGHSLGAQVAGFVGKRIFQRTCEKLARITLSDPSALGFELPTVRNDEKAYEEDADFVDVIHSDMGHYGCIDPVGHVDFYPNGGKEQPGCPELCDDDDCSRSRAILYFIESITSDEFKSAPSENFDEFIEGIFAEEDIIVFGYNCPTEARGVHYFATNETPPYAQGDIYPKVFSDASDDGEEGDQGEEGEEGDQGEGGE
nr:pancreatic lipase-related protein 2-like [Onthophagus taurus]